MRRTLHDLCQPLTTLEGLLYLQTLTRGSGSELTAADSGLWRSLDEALQECNRVFTIVRSIQDRLIENEKATAGLSTRLKGSAEALGPAPPAETRTMNGQQG